MSTYKTVDKNGAPIKVGDTVKADNGRTFKIGGFFPGGSSVASCKSVVLVTGAKDAAAVVEHSGADGDTIMWGT